MAREDEYLDIPADAPYVVSITGDGDDYDVAVIIPALIDDDDDYTNDNDDDDMKYDSKQSYKPLSNLQSKTNSFIGAKNNLITNLRRNYVR